MSYNELRATAKQLNIKLDRNPKKEVLLDLITLYAEADEFNLTIYPDMDADEVRDALTEHKKVLADTPKPEPKKRASSTHKKPLVPIISLSKGAKLKTASGKFEWTITERVERDGKIIRILMVDNQGKPWNCTSVKDLAKNVVAI